LLQRLLPYDFRIRAHVLTTMALTVFLAWHTVYYVVVTPKDLTLTTWVLMVTFPLLVLLSVLWIPVPGMKRFRTWLLSGAKTAATKGYDLLKVIHKGLYIVLAALTYVHIVDAKIIGVASPASSLGFQVLFLITLTAYVWTRVRNRLLPTVEVVSVASHGGITRLTLTNHPRLRYQAGQFAFLRFAVRGLRGEEHPFSFVSAGHEDTLEFAVKHVGDFTKKLAGLVPGDKVRVNAGFGSFSPRSKLHRAVFIGTGVGAAPILSILKDLAARGHQGPLTGFVAVSRRDELIDPHAWEQLRQRLPGLDLSVLVSSEGAPRLEAVLARLKDPAECDYWLCASDKVRRDLVRILRTLEVPAAQIHFEAFSLG
jgi:3-phenylpropionate/trans-cinnamate dioxygenase ferredoxin reductase subunit